MQPLIVYTAITGDIDDIISPINAARGQENRPVRYVCFSDSLLGGPTGWEFLPVRVRDRDPRRTARWHKVMRRLLFPEAEFTLWHGASQCLRVNPWDAIDCGLPDDHVFATFKHPVRDCVYQEIHACIILGKDVPRLPALLRKQAERYRRDVYPPHRRGRKSIYFEFRPH
jgi:hypothetical protein